MFKRLLRLLTSGLPDMDEYHALFVVKLQDRAEKLGVPDDVAAQMWADAVSLANPTVVGQAPGSIMNRMLDAWEVENR